MIRLEDSDSILRACANVHAATKTIVAAASDTTSTSYDDARKGLPDALSTFVTVAQACIGTALDTAAGPPAFPADQKTVEDW